MMILNTLRGRITFEELRNMPNRYFHTLYYRAYLEGVEAENRKKAEEKRNKNSKTSKDNHAQNFQGNVIADMRAAREAMEQLQDEM